MARRITWNGTTEEALALLQALQAHCECRSDAGRTVAPCAVHVMLTHDQRAIDGLLFMRRGVVLVEEADGEEAEAPQHSDFGPRRLGR